jgi:hypothetical protein
MAWQRTWTFIPAVLLFALLGQSCVGASPAVREGVAHHVYKQPLPQLWPQVEAFMTEQGYTWRTAKGQYALRTEWRENGTSGANRTLVSYLVQGEPHPSGGCVLRVSRGLKADSNALSQGDPSQLYVPGTNASGNARDQLAQEELSMQSQRAIYAPSRDLDMELALLRKLDPSAAASLEQPPSTAAR